MRAIGPYIVARQHTDGEGGHVRAASSTPSHITVSAMWSILAEMSLESHLYMMSCTLWTQKLYSWMQESDTLHEIYLWSKGAGDKSSLPLSMSWKPSRWAAEYERKDSKARISRARLGRNSLCKQQQTTWLEELESKLIYRGGRRRDAWIMLYIGQYRRLELPTPSGTSGHNMTFFFNLWGLWRILKLGTVRKVHASCVPWPNTSNLRIMKSYKTFSPGPYESGYQSKAKIRPCCDHVSCLSRHCKLQGWWL